VTTCPHCGYDYDAPPERWTRGPLVAQLEPPAVYCGGIRLPLVRQQAVILAHLVRRGEASTTALEAIAVGPCASAKAVHVRISQMRKMLPAGITIENVRGWGYRLVM